MHAQYKDQPRIPMLPAPSKVGRQATIGKKHGTYLKPKQLVFGDLEVLVPKVKNKTTYPIVDPLENCKSVEGSPRRP